MTSYYDPEWDPDDEPDIPEPRTEAQPDDFCECRPGVELRQRSQHAPECLRWAPPLTGPGHSPEHRARALAYIRSQIGEARRRHQEKPAEESA